MFFTALKDLIVDTLDELDTYAAEVVNDINPKKKPEPEEDKHDD